MAAEIEESSVERVDMPATTDYQSLHDLIKDLTKTPHRADNNLRGSSQTPASCCHKTKTGLRIFWTVTRNTSWTITSLANYARRSMIPLAALGQYNKETRETLLTCIGILQIISETTEATYDYSSTQLIKREKKLTKLHLQYKEEKEVARDKALAKCVQKTLPNLRLQSNHLSHLGTKNLRRLYDPQSRHLSELEDQLTTHTDITSCEKAYEKARVAFWTKSYPAFWIIGVGLSLTQILVVATGLLDSDDTLPLGILLIAVEALKYFSERMKHIGQEEEYQKNKLRKDYSPADDMV